MINNQVEKIRLALLIEYNGKNLVGWQKQNNGKSVQGEIEQVAKILFKIDCPVQGAGRTDAGVNALGQVAHIDIPKFCLLYTSPSPRDWTISRMPSSA